MTDEEIEANALSDPDAQPVTDEQWEKGRWVRYGSEGEIPQVLVSVDMAVADFFQQSGDNGPQQINTILREYIAKHQNQSAA